MQVKSSELRRATNRFHVVLFWIGWALLMLMISSCAWYRSDTEKFYYDYAVKSMKMGINSKIRDKCNFTFEVDMPTFSNVDQTDLDLMYKTQHMKYKIGGYYSTHQKKIVYSKWKPEIVSHEAVHHLVHANGTSRACLEEMLAEMVQYAVELDSEVMRMHNELSKRK